MIIENLYNKNEAGELQNEERAKFAGTSLRLS